MFRLFLSAVVCFLLSSNLEAAVLPIKSHQCKGDSVYVPCEPNAWGFGGELLIFSEREGAFNFLQEITPRLGAGFRVEGTYQYQPSNELVVDWAHYNVRTGLGANTFQNAASGVLANGTINYQSQFDIVNLTLGQYIAMGDRWDWQAFAGLQYAHLGDDMSAPLGILNPTGASSWRLRVDSVGPNAGFYGSYYFDEGVSIYAKSSYSVLSGSETVDVVGCGPSICQLPIGPSTSTQGNRNLMITHAMIQLGFKYQKLISEGRLTVRGGYESHEFMSPVPVDTRIGSGIFYRSLAWSGGYIGLTWLGLA